jgi:hypothetical protein
MYLGNAVARRGSGLPEHPGADLCTLSGVNNIERMQIGLFPPATV